VLAILSGILVHFGDHLEHTSWWQMVSKLLMVLAGAGMIGRATRPASTDKVEPPRPTGN
jgi:hypothetical protein